MRQRTAGLIVVVFGILVAGGGAYGYAREESVPSLVSGLASGVLLAISGRMIGAGRAGGRPLAIALCAALAVFFGYRFAKSSKPMPAVPVIALAALTAVAAWRSKAPAG